ncbi:C-X-C chemokine receptor type 2-like [Pseudochaenichthys georgianus]|uniref:C-X-C chemokine receptor type 2-like n=1 Tax=Pseudochaenichthys georgianus TaxID=52239 RepID=UPI00146C21E4|nr:C-X-C chemokine receptor type 2-like isoform X1 [Pseudochaenichthys georgianus]XP_033955849.1 C-X-C chemokine receptor type 2-like isoform X1 [Pseudochaenichthys georgianus]
MSLDFNYEEVFPNYTIHENHTPYVVDPNTLSCETEPLPATPALTLCLILIAIFLLAIPGNLLVGWVIGTSRGALTPSDLYLFHLTIADGLMALTIPFWAIALLKGWIFGDFLCKFLNLVFDANFYTSILFLACISVDRYLVIVHASENVGTRQRKSSRLLCVVVWACSWVLALPALFNDAFKQASDSERMLCHENFDIGSATSWRNVTHGFRLIFGFLLPLFVMIYCYSVTIAKVLQSRGFRKHRAMKVIIAVVVVFLLCWMPYHTTMIVDILMRTDLISFDCALRMSVNQALVITNSLALFHSCINPVLYAFMGEKFRKKTMQLFQQTNRQERVSRTSRSTSQTSEGNGAIL